jgi:hypothetical protein
MIVGDTTSDDQYWDEEDSAMSAMVVPGATTASGSRTSSGPRVGIPHYPKSCIEGLLSLTIAGRRSWK